MAHTFFPTKAHSFRSTHTARFLALALIMLLTAPLLPWAATADTTLSTSPLRSLWNEMTAVRKPKAGVPVPTLSQTPLEQASLVTRLLLCPRVFTAQVGETITLVPTPLDQHDQVVQGVGYLWQSSDPAVATVTSWGEVETHAPGTALITVQAGSQQLPVSVTVRDGKRVRLNDRQWDAEHAGDCAGHAPRFNPEEAAGTVRAPQQRDSRVQRAVLRIDKTGVQTAGPNPTGPVEPAQPVAFRQGGSSFFDGGSSEDTVFPAAAAALNATGSPRFGPVEGSTGGTTKTRNNLGNSNFTFTAPVLALNGRGIGVNLALTYNSRVWSKDRAANKMTFNYTKGWPSSGWSLGYGRIIENYNGTRSSGSNGSGIGFANDPGDALLIQPDGTRLVLKEAPFDSGENLWMLKTTDGTFLSYNPANGKLQYPDGTQVKYELGATTNNRRLPVSIRTRNGDLLLISYRPYDSVNFPFRWAINQITDTLGRVTSFKYYGSDFPADAANGKPNAALASVWTTNLSGGGSQELVQLQYQNVTLQYNFAASLQVENSPANNSQITVLRRIGYPQTGQGYVFQTNSYGMIDRISVRKDMIGGAGIGDGTEIAWTRYNYPNSTTQAGALNDSPQFTERAEWWTGKTDADGTPTADPSLYTYSRQYNTENPPTQTITQNLPYGLEVVTTVDDDDFDTNKLYGTVKNITMRQGVTTYRQIANTYAQPPTGGGFQGGFQIGTVTSTNEAGDTTRTDYTYGNYGRVETILEYGVFPGPIQRSTKFTYLNTQSYLDAGFFNLATGIEVYEGNLQTLRAKTTFAYDSHPQGLLSYGALPPNHDSAFNGAYTIRGNVTETTQYATVSPVSTIPSTTRYDIFGNPVQSEVSCCHLTTAQFSSNTGYSLPDSITRGSGPSLTTSFQYEAGLKLLRYETDPDNLTTEYAYDPINGQLLQINGPTGATNFVGVDEDGFGNHQLSTFTRVNYLDNGTNRDITSRRWFNGAGLLVRAGTGAGVSPSTYDAVAVTYDALGRPTRQSNPYQGNASGSGSASFWTASSYDAISRVFRVTLPDNQVIQTQFAGNEATVTDQVGRSRKSQVDGLGRLIRVTEENPATGSLDLTTDYAYDILDNLTQVNQGGQIRSFQSDALGRTVSETTPEGGTTAFTYNGFGAVQTRTDARNVVTTYTYETSGLNRMIGISYNTSGSGVPPTAGVTINYKTTAPGKGQISSVTDGAGTETYSYDGFGRLSSRTQTLDSRNYTVGYEYNEAGQDTELVYPSGKRIRMNHDQRGRLSGMDKLNSGGGLIGSLLSGVTYDVAGHLTNLNLGNGVVETYGYNNDRLQLTSQTVTKGAATLMNLSYGYAAAAGASGAGTNAGNSSQLMSITGTVDGQNRNQAFTYDDVGRLVTATGWGVWQRRYGYDRWGNRTGTWNATVGGTQIQNVTIQTSGSQPNNRIASLNGVAQTYDAAGNLTNDGAQLYQYDAENRLVTVGNGAVATYLYDSANRRVKKTVGSASTHYIWEGGQVIAEYNAASGALLTEYVYAGRRLLTREEGAVVRYYHSDRLSTRLVTDSTGAKVGTSDTLPFGNEANSCGENDKRVFTSYERDDETGSDYAVNRQYQQRTGRFTRPDPLGGSIGNPQSLNRYSYSLNDPINLIDSLGLDPLPADILNKVRMALNTKDCQKLFKGMDPIGILDELLKRQGVQVNAMVPELSESNIKERNGRKYAQITSYNFDIRYPGVAAVTTPGAYNSETGKILKVVTVNPRILAVTKMYKDFEDLTKEIPVLAAALVIHELLHVAGTIDDDANNSALSLEHTRTVLKNCFTKQASGTVPRKLGFSDRNRRGGNYHFYSSPYPPGLLEAFLFLNYVNSIPVGGERVDIYYDWD